ncbi:MAG: hypothetical protein J5823_03515 [Paludibacteraceae bacterium]|nr:hypothetical protein [Paludibacteraceae bacterium]
MKTVIKILSVLFVCVMLAGCQSPTNAKYKAQYVFYFFKFADPEYQNHIIAKLDTFNGKNKIILPSAFPRRDLYNEYYYLENKYLYIDKDFVRCDTAGVQQEIEKTDLCDLSKGPRLIELEDGYFTWYPFTAIPVNEVHALCIRWWEDNWTKFTMQEMPPVVLSARWEDICTFDPDTVQIISKQPYSQCCGLIHMYQYTKDMSTDELVETINRLIKEKDFAHGGTESHPWFK